MNEFNPAPSTQLSTAPSPVASPTPPLLFLTDVTASGQRLDRWLATQLPTESRSTIQRWIKEGHVQVDGSLARASHKIEDHQQIVVTIPTPVVVQDLQGEALPLQILYEDADLLVIDKAAGMVVHPAPGHDAGTLVNAVLYHCPDLEGVGGEHRPGIVHRLDKETSGVLVVAKNDRTLRYLQAQFQARTVYKEYIALVEGRITPPQGRINAPIGRHPVDRKRQAILAIDPTTGEGAGRAAITDYYLEKVYTLPGQGNNALSRFSLVRVVLYTGRTHQIRVHFAWYKHPVVGDTLYGYQRRRLPLQRQFLHAHKLRLRLPSTDQEQEFIAPLPTELERLLQQLATEA